MRRALLIMLAALLPSCLLCLGSPRAPLQDATYRVQVEMVSLPVVVTDEAGSHARNLRQEDFLVFEDGVPQDITGFAAVQEPVSVALMLDVSGSTESQLRRIQDEAMRFVDILRPDDSIALLSVADHVKVLMHFSVYHKKDSREFANKVRQCRSGGLSAVYDGVAYALDRVLKHEYGRKALVFFSDGIDNRSEEATEETTLDMARQTEAPIYSIRFVSDKFRNRIPGQFDRPGGKLQQPRKPGGWPPRVPLPRKRGESPEDAAGRNYLEKLSAYSGGLCLDASRIENLGSAFRRIALELSSQYSIGYYPKNRKHDGAFRRVEVRTVKPGLLARTRQGYYSRKEGENLQ